MSNLVKLSNYLPGPSEIPAANILDARQSLETLIKAWWPELDTRPNSVFGDLHLTPLAVLFAAMDIAQSRRESDLNLDNLASGVVYNSDFAKAYLANFGVVAGTAIAASGVVRLVFSEDKLYSIDSSTVVTFGSVTCRFSPDEGSPILIYPTGTPNQKRVLTRTGDNEYVVYFPVSAPATSVVSDGTQGVINLAQPEFVRVEAAGDFDPGQGAPSLAALAQQARRGFFAASLTTRTGTLSFLAQRFPNLVGAAVVVSGDAEMLRDSSNIVGLKGGKVDVYFKSRVSPLSASQAVQLTWSPIDEAWVGKLTTPVPPAFFDLTAGIFRVDNFDNQRSVNMVYGKSADTAEDNLGVAFSSKEILGVKVTDTNPQDIQNAYIGNVTNLTGSAAQLIVQGTYKGYVFSDQAARSVRLKFDKLTTVYLSTFGGSSPSLLRDESGNIVEGEDGSVIGGETGETAVNAVWATVRDVNSGETVRVIFTPNSSTSPTAGLAQPDANFDTILGGLELSVSSAPNTFDPASLIGQQFDFNFQGRTATFMLNYRYDPSFISVAGLLTNPDNQSPGVSVLPKNFVPCYIKQFDVQYRAAFGATVNLDSAKADIFNYLSGLTYPDLYEESQIGMIMLKYGAAGLIRVDKQGVIYPSLAGRYEMADGSEIVVTRELTTTLMPSRNDLGYGARNLAYLVDLNSITFHATTF